MAYQMLDKVSLSPWIPQALLVTKLDLLLFPAQSGTRPHTERRPTLSHCWLTFQVNPFKGCSVTRHQHVQDLFMCVKFVLICHLV
jgi:hypothetical protein